MASATQFVNYYNAYPDNDEVKQLYVEAQGMTYAGAGERHVQICWSNGAFVGGYALQTIELGGPPGGYHYVSPVVHLRRMESMGSNEQFSLGYFSRAQRNRILALAVSVHCDMQSVLNGPRVWVRDLLEAMVRAELLPMTTFAEISARVPLPRRVMGA